MARITRRKLFKLSAAGAVAAQTGGFAAILATGRTPAFARGTTIHWVRGSDYVPVSDQLVTTKLNEQAQKDLGLKINLEGVDGLTIQARVTSSAQSGTGSDIISAINNWAQLYADSVADVSGRRRGNRKGARRLLRNREGDRLPHDELVNIYA